MKEINGHFKEIKKILEEEAKSIKEYILNGNEFKSKIFHLCDLNEINKKKATAIYIFQILDEVKIPKDFDEIKYAAKLNKNIIQFNKNDILYLGKSFDIKKRIAQHTVSASSRTYSLRLNDKKRNCLKDKYKIYIFECLSTKYYNIILSTVESILHVSLQPLVGSKRV